MKELNLYKLFEICKKLSYKETKLSEEKDVFVSLLGNSSSFSAYSFECFLNYYSFKIEDACVVVFNNEPVAWEDFSVNDFSYVPSVLLSLGEKDLEKWIEDEVEKQLKQQEEQKSAEKENLKLEIERLTKRYNNL